MRALPFSRGGGGGSGGGGGPIFRRGTLQLPEGAPPKDTFLDTAGLSKGLLWVNGVALGRYWESAGPQHTLYVPAPFLKPGANEVILLDLHGAEAAEIASVAAPRYSQGRRRRTGKVAGIAAVGAAGAASITAAALRVVFAAPLLPLL